MSYFKNSKATRSPLIANKSRITSKKQTHSIVASSRTVASQSGKKGKSPLNNDDEIQQRSLLSLAETTPERAIEFALNSPPLLVSEILNSTVDGLETTVGRIKLANALAYFPDNRMAKLRLERFIAAWLGSDDSANAVKWINQAPQSFNDVNLLRACATSAVGRKLLMQISGQDQNDYFSRLETLLSIGRIVARENPEDARRWAQTISGPLRKQSVQREVEDVIKSNETGNKYMRK